MVVSHPAAPARHPPHSRPRPWLCDGEREAGVRYGSTRDGCRSMCNLRATDDGSPGENCLSARLPHSPMELRAHCTRARIYSLPSWPRPRVPSRTPPLRGQCLSNELGHAVPDYVRSAMCIPLLCTDGISSPVGLPRGPSVPNGRVPIQYVADVYLAVSRRDLTVEHQA